jgi:Rrf2 family protein
VLKLTRKTEYALLSLRWLSRDPTTLSSVREIAEHYHIPPTLLAKVLQRLKSGGIVISVKGSAGGYGLSRPLSGVLLTDVLALFHEQNKLVDCLVDEDGCGCEQILHCDIRQPMESLNRLLMAQLAGLSLDAFFDTRPGVIDDRTLSIGRFQPLD